MDVIGRLAELATGVMFLAAGGYKLADGPAWPKQAADMGVPRWLALLVPWFELALGALLLTGLFSPWPAVAAVLTLLVFTVVIVNRLLDGTRPPCACFGARSKKPLGPGHVIRNGVLLLVACAAVVGA